MLNIFYGCTGLTSITVQSGNPKYDSRENCNAIIETATNTLVCGCKNTTIPNSVTTIGEDAFYGCTGLTSITIPNSVTTIGYSAFRDCGLTSVTIGNSVTYIGSSAFEYCSNLKKVITPDIAAWLNIYFSSYSSNPLCYAHHLYSDENTEITNLVILDGVTTINRYAFYGGSGFTSITIPNSVTTIGSEAFRYYSGLTSIDIPKSMNTIGDKAFAGCSNLKLITCDRETPPSAEKESFPAAIAIVPPASVEQYRKAIGWSSLVINGTFAIDGSTQTTITLGTHSSFTDVSATLNGTQYYPTDGKIVITGLNPNTTYTIDAKGKYGDKELENTLTVKTKSISVDFSGTSTNKTITLKGTYDAGDATIEKYGFEGYPEGTELMLDNLVPGKEYSFTFYVTTPDGQKFQRTSSVSTQPVRVNCSSSNPGVTTCQLTGDFTVIDATVLDYGFTNYSGQKELALQGLDPNTKYTYTFYVNTKEGGKQTSDVTFTTKPLTLTTLQPKVASPGNVIVAAQSNIEYDGENVGFEWRRTDWTSDFKSNEGAAYLYEGMMEGYIRNLSTDKLWKFRPYYEAKSGKRYYGDWMGLDPTNTSYFEPTVHTYASVQVDGNTAQVRGYAMRGSDNTAQQGFKYWKTGAAQVRGAAKAVSVPKNALTVTAEGNVMEAELKGLDYGSEYCYVAFVTTTEGKTFYGEQQTFKTEAGQNGGTTTEEVPVQLPASGYATFYSSAKSYALPSGFTAKVVTGVSDNRIVYETIADGSKSKNTVPAGVPVMLENKARRSATCTLTLSEQKDKYTGTNLLEGTDVKTTVSPAADEYVYKLSYGPSNTEYSKVFGWYWGAADGAGFEIGAHKAWLKVKKAKGTRGYAVDGEMLGISNCDGETPAMQSCYDLQGRRIEQPTRKGLYIVNGKKMVKK